MPSDDVDIYVDQLHKSITDVIDELAPLKTCTRRCGKRPRCWLSDAAVQAKKERRRLERRWTKTRCEADRVAYRSACRHANLEMNRSRQSFYQNRLQESAGDHRSQWKTVRELLHIDSRRQMEPAEARRLCGQFSRFC